VPATKIGAEPLLDVTATAYERTSLIVTTNLPFESGQKSSARNDSPAPPSTGSPTAAASSNQRR
jgi:hypothetical protein